MKKEVANVTFVLENCETLKVHCTDIVLIHIGDITRTISGSRGKLSHNLKSDSFFFGIHKDAQILDESFLGTIDISRLSDDVTYIELEYEDDSTETIQVEWFSDDNNPMSSEHQSSFKTPAGHHVWISDCTNELDALAECVDFLAAGMR